MYSDAGLASRSSADGSGSADAGSFVANVRLSASQNAMPRHTPPVAARSPLRVEGDHARPRKPGHQFRLRRRRTVMSLLLFTAPAARHGAVGWVFGEPDTSNLSRKPDSWLWPPSSGSKADKGSPGGAGPFFSTGLVDEITSELTPCVVMHWGAPPGSSPFVPFSTAPDGRMAHRSSHRRKEPRD